MAAAQMFMKIDMRQLKMSIWVRRKALIIQPESLSRHLMPRRQKLLGMRWSQPVLAIWQVAAVMARRTGM